MSEPEVPSSARRASLAAVPAEALQHPSSIRAFRGLKLLLGGYLGLSVLTLAAVYLLRGDTALVTDAVWVRAGIVVVSALLTYVFAARAARGSRGAYRRMRIVATVMTVAIAVIIAIPGSFPAWLKIEQGICGLALLGVLVVANGGHVRGLFAAK
ncbi:MULTISPECIES: hypothetical protein [unclassified Streptomyces]|uniref:hypothetical protein n=1 Tax=unclassified Streptomyces TaxID=2593676 RepID=UPI00037D7593|nr:MULTISPECIES: hypothetical protein [unclassified Streptomyces]MYT34050.1 hypothetical protein [Streptomyces sp. SID8354]